MIIYTHPDTGYQCKCSHVFIPESLGVPYREVPSHERDEFNDAITDYDVDGNPVFDLAKAKEIKAAKAHETCEAALKVITTQYSEAEMKTWDIQEAEARAYIADNTAPTPFLSALVASGSYANVLEVANKIITNADAFKGISATEIGKRQKMEKAAAAALTIDELKAVTY